MSLPQKFFRYIFWTGYFTVLITAFLPVTGELNKINIGPDAFHIRLDHLIHLLVYFLICMYFLFGKINGLNLFEKNPILKFVLVITILATVTEVVQLWVPERAFNVFDLASNLTGLTIGIGVTKMASGHQGIKV